MPTTRRQTAIAEGKIKVNDQHASSTPRKRRRPSKHINHDESEGDSEMKEAGQALTRKQGKKRETEQAGGGFDEEIKAHLSSFGTDDKSEVKDKQHIFKPGTIERGHIYFFYRPRVQLAEAHSIDDIRNFHILLIPRPAEVMTEPALQSKGKGKEFDPAETEEAEMKALATGADAVPAKDDGHSTKKHFRLITVGKKRLPDPQSPGTEGSRRKELFWGSVTAVGDDLELLAKGLEEKSYETKTRGTRHQGAARLVARGGYAIVNSEGKTPSSRETHLGYHVSHPNPTDMGDVQSSLGIYSASSFILQVKNPLAPATGPQQVHSKPAEYPLWIKRDVFGGGKGKAHTKGRESYGLRFVACETPELLDYQGAEILLIASRDGQEGLEKSLGDDQGRALSELSEKEARESVQQVFDELGLDLEKFPMESLEGSWI